MKLTELLNTEIPVKVANSSDTDFKTRSKIGSHEIEFHAMLDRYSSGLFWTVEFSELQPDFDKNYKLTGHGNELAVFTMVKKSMEMFIEKYSPDLIVFTSTSENGKLHRSNVYERLLKKFKIPGYSFKRIQTKIDGIDEFHIEKIKPS